VPAGRRSATALTRTTGRDKMADGRAGPRRLQASKYDQGVARAGFRGLTSGSEARTELVRDATIMVLYVSVVEIAELAAIPESHSSHGRVTGPVGGALLAIVWGTAVGLALAHWFAFVLAARAFRGEQPTNLDTKIGIAQVAAAMLVAALSSLPVLLFSDTLAQETTGDVPAILVGVVGYLIARHTGTSRLASVFYGATALVVGVLVALVKNTLAGH
jgi:hypothetical protein